MALGAASLGTAGAAWAQPEPDPVIPADPLAGLSEETIAEAMKLFHEGRRLLTVRGKLDEACDTLAKSYALAKRGDTLLNLAECHRRQGKTATAWREFDIAILYARDVQFTEAIEVAKTLRDELAGKLSKLTVVVPEATAALPGLVVTLGGEPFPKARYGEDRVVDPGPYQVAATAPGYQPFERNVEVGAEADRQRVEVTLEKVPPPPLPPPPLPPPPAPPPQPQAAGAPVWAWVVGGAGIGLLGAAAAFGADTVAAGGTLDDTCGDGRQACPLGYDFEPDRAREQRGYALFVGLGAAGLAAVGVGAVGLGLSLGGDEPAASAELRPWATAGGGGLSVAGSF